MPVDIKLCYAERLYTHDIQWFKLFYRANTFTVLLSFSVSQIRSNHWHGTPFFFLFSIHTSLNVWTIEGAAFSSLIINVWIYWVYPINFHLKVLIWMFELIGSISRYLNLLDLEKYERKINKWEIIKCTSFVVCSFNPTALKGLSR